VRGGRWLLACLIVGSLIACAPEPAASNCPESDPIWPTQPDCEDAIAAALEAWPSDADPPRVVTYRWDYPCPPGWECPASGPGVGFVVFEFHGTQDDVYAAVEDRNGALVVSEFLPLPP